MLRVTRVRGFAVAATVAALVVPGLASQQEPQPPTPQSAARVKEVVELLQAKELTSFAVADPQREGRFVAALHIPGVQLMVVAADYGRPTDIEYRIYHQEFMTAYMDLNSSTLASGKFFVEDTLADGLVPVPEEGTPGDVVRIDNESRTFDGEFANPRRRNDERISQADYYKAFQDADARYARLLGVMADALKK